VHGDELVAWSINPYILFGAIGFIIPLIVKNLYQRFSFFLGIDQLSTQHLDALQIVFSLLIVSCMILVTFKYVPEGHRALVVRSDSSHRTLEPGIHLLNPLQERVVFEALSCEQSLIIDTHHFHTKDSIKLSMGILVFWRVTELWQAHKLHKLEEKLKQRVINALYAEIGFRKADEVSSLKPDIDTLSLGVEVIRTKLVNIQKLEVAKLVDRQPDASSRLVAERQTQFAVRDAEEIMKVAKLIYNPPIPEEHSTRIMNHLLHKHFLTSDDLIKMDDKSKITLGALNGDKESNGKKPG
jgi:hypothetical protein